MQLAHRFQGQKVKGQGHQAHYADTHRAPYLPNGKAYELRTCYTDEGQRPASAAGTDLQGQRSKSQGLVISQSRLGPMLYLCH